MARITCRICGEELEPGGTPPVSCLACDTPFHVDCWAYNGSRCGVYGCRGHRAMAGLRGGAVATMRPATSGKVDWHCPRWQPVVLGAPFLGLAALALGGLASSCAGLVLLALAVLAFERHGLFQGRSWLTAVAVERDGLVLEYWLQPVRRLGWEQIVEGPGTGGRGDRLRLSNGRIIWLPAGEPGFDSVQRRLAAVLGMRCAGADLAIADDD